MKASGTQNRAARQAVRWLGGLPQMLLSDVITDDDDYRIVNTSFPHIGKRIAAVWGQPEFNLLILQLLRDSRGGTREGFPPHVRLALVRLEARFQREFRELTIPPSSMWDLNNYL
jgi:hypothetical protein